MRRYFSDCLICTLTMQEQHELGAYIAWSISAFGVGKGMKIAAGPTDGA
jgi:hypothetical protein